MGKRHLIRPLTVLVGGVAVLSVFAYRDWTAERLGAPLGRLPAPGPAVAFAPAAPSPGRVLDLPSYTVFHNEPLARPVPLASLQPPNDVVLSDGRRFALRSVRLLRPVTLAQAFPNEVDPSGSAPVQVEPVIPGATSTRVDFRARNMYFCGNTRGSLPMYRRQDLGTHLVALGLALPTLDVLESDPAYARELGQCSRGVT